MNVIRQESSLILDRGQWPHFDDAPKIAFIDVDGTLLAETTTFLFARILKRRGLIKRSFVLRACITACNIASVGSITAAWSPSA